MRIETKKSRWGLQSKTYIEEANSGNLPLSISQLNEKQKFDRRMPTFYREAPSLRKATIFHE